MKICMIGSGYVGLVTGACFAEMGHEVTCVDKDSTRVKRLKKGEIPFYEPGLKEIVLRNQQQKRLAFSLNLSQALAGAEIVFIAVGTPPQSDGSSDVSQIMTVATEIGRGIKGFCTIVNKSTAPVGTVERVRDTVRRELAKRRVDIDFDVASNPEFLKEGNAVEDFMRPDRVVVGTDNDRAVKLMRALYIPYTRNHERFIAMGIRDAELTKYAANAMLATRISFMNEIANLCERLGVDVENVRVGIGSDSRIGYSFIYAGCGYGGSCFPKDVQSLIHQGRQAKLKPRILEAVEETNENQKLALFNAISQRFGRRLKGKIIGVWGLAFKPNTDDMREAPSVVLIRKLIEAGAQVRAYDPVAMKVAQRMLPQAWFKSGALKLAKDQYAALKGADALALVTEWKPFRAPDLHLMKKIMRQQVIFDGRNQYDRAAVTAEGFEYRGIGR
jgi:UDPglucose 6-dehydrogenase